MKKTPLTKLVNAERAALAFVRDYVETADCGDGVCGRDDGTCWHCTASRIVKAATGKEYPFKGMKPAHEELGDAMADLRD